MGIPAYFAQLLKKCPQLMNKLSTYKNNSPHNLFMDCNSIIYDVVHSTEYKQDDHNSKRFEDIVTDKVIDKIQEYINIINPQHITYIAFDGVAPFAKMNHQRARRYTGCYESSIYSNLISQNNKDTSESNLESNSGSWDTSAITPTTAFMNMLDEKCKKHNAFYGKGKIIYSGHLQPGEGEHKLFQYIRTHKKTHSEVSFIYGMDADLIMLSLNHLQYAPKLYLFRELPEYIIQKEDEEKSVVVDIPMVAAHYASNLGSTQTSNIHVKITDYVLICFLLGNDFLPRFPAINIRTGGLTKVIDAYKYVATHSNEGVDEFSLIDRSYQLNWNNLKLLFQYLSNLESTFITTEINTRREIRDKRKRYCKEIEDPLIIERQVHPGREGWQHRYYTLFIGLDEITEETKQDTVHQYLHMLQWVYMYYITNPKDKWMHYSYAYPPLLEDLSKMNTSTINCDSIIHPSSTKIRWPTHKYQLDYVLPDSKKYLINQLYQSGTNQATKKRGLYTANGAFCTYDWERHLQI